MKEFEGNERVLKPFMPLVRTIAGEVTPVPRDVQLIVFEIVSKYRAHVWREGDPPTAEYLFAVKADQVDLVLSRPYSLTANELLLPCGHRDGIEAVQESVTLIERVATISYGGEVEYKGDQDAYNNGSIAMRFQCCDCGQVLTDQFGATISNEEELVDWAYWWVEEGEEEDAAKRLELAQGAN